MSWLRRLGTHLSMLILLAVVATIVASCTTIARIEWDKQFGPPAPADRSLAVPLAQYKEPEYYRDVKPIFDRRCVVCHGCYDAPCQLKLSSFSGIDRGTSSQKVYDGSRLIAENLTRLFVDAQSTEQWRGKGFYPVLNEYTQDSPTNLRGSSLYQMLLLKRQHPLSDDGPLPNGFDFSLDRQQSCMRVETFAEYAKQNEQAGMPYGMPAIEENYYQTIKRWLETGAKVAAPADISAAQQSEVQRWEQFLNGDSLTQQLMSRYIYEHLYLGDLYFEQPNSAAQQSSADTTQTNTNFFKLVRSRTPPGQPADLIASRRPFDDPGVPRAYYRLEQIHETFLVKTHMPYVLNQPRMDKWRAWFLNGDYTVTELPSYAPEIASNPFKAFRELPSRSRYRFMLDEAQFTIMGFIKGPVCRGQIALNVINDQFWVVFLDPDSLDSARASRFIEQQSDNLRLPAEAESNAVPINWRVYSQSERRFLDAKTAFLEQALAKRGPRLSDIWNGDGVNQNAALTVFRHFDSATVVQGLVGDTPKTAWVIDYSLLERIHYLLVAGYDVYGNVGHQLMTRMYMDFLRMEGEFNFLAFLPEQERLRERQFWYRNVNDDIADFVYGPRVKLDRDTMIQYHSDNPKAEFFVDLRNYLGPALNQRWNLSKQADISLAAGTESALRNLQQMHGAQLRFLPQLASLSITINGQKKPFTLVHNTGHANVSTLLFEDSRLLPDEDTLSLAQGILGAYPAAFFDLDEAQLPQFVAAINTLSSEADYRVLTDRFGIRRNSARFWPHSDWLHEKLRQQSTIEAGILDYNRFENR